MDKSVLGLLGAVGALAVGGTAQAASHAPVSLDDVMRVESYADLLKPIPNALVLHQQLAEAQDASPATPDVMTVQYYHHHHHRYYHRRFYHHHHHHHFVRHFLRHGIGVVIR